MNTLTKISILVLVLLAIAFQSVTPAHADQMFPNHDEVTGSKANSHIIPAWSVKHTDGVTISAPLMQDLTQCHLTDNGELVCVDVCGGASVPGSICSFE